MQRASCREQTARLLDGAQRCFQTHFQRLHSSSSSYSLASLKRRMLEAVARQSAPPGVKKPKSLQNEAQAKRAWGSQSQLTSLNSLECKHEQHASIMRMSCNIHGDCLPLSGVRSRSNYLSQAASGQLRDAAEASGDSSHRRHQGPIP